MVFQKSDRISVQIVRKRDLVSWRRWFSNKMFSLHGRSGIDPWDITLEKLRGRAGHRLGKRTEAVGSPNHGR
ncbi:hypothetical protein AGR2A_pa40015 [Agrobacterium genomosp. 2 str. CFBP 5494]|uniref:Uncharacterized protein n=1 Tax=Agrobacterium genomosp. 2 str. CFBP 5494 TaxID=1183436 RepID=A0A9W5F5I5_9HYPH|nr:hypothetical protein AGR2A_pa40015 [Agrobacterium genomosp. 2 str. CFBP 5494]